MRQDLSELIFIIDRSGSMYGLESDTIGGFNRVLEENAKAPGECNITTYFFSDHAELIHDRIPVRGVHPITSKRLHCRRLHRSSGYAWDSNFQDRAHFRPHR